jgi:hypothetical protein
MFRVSDNVTLFPASNDTTTMFSEDSVLIRGGADARRIILRADNVTLLSRLPLEAEGLWVQGNDISEGEQPYYTGAAVVRLPFEVQGVEPAIPLAEPFALAGEPGGEGEEGDAAGTLVGGPERSVLRVYHAPQGQEPESEKFTSRHTEQMLHGGSRWIEFDSGVALTDVRYCVQGPDTLVDNIEIVKRGRGAYINDKGACPEYILNVYTYMGDILTQVLKWVFGASKLGLRDAVGGKLGVVGVGEAAVPIRVEPDENKLLPPEVRDKGKVVIRTEGWACLYDAADASTRGCIYPPAGPVESFTSDPMSWTRYAEMLLNREEVFVGTGRGGNGSVSITFQFDGSLDDFHTEKIDYTGIKVKSIHAIDPAGNPIKPSFVVNERSGINLYVVFYPGPTLEQIKSHIALALAFYGGKDGAYPAQICEPVSLYADGTPANDARIAFGSEGTCHYVRLHEFYPGSHLPPPESPAEVSIEGPLYTYDIYKDEGQLPDDCDALERGKPGLIYGKSRCGADDCPVELDVARCVSPPDDENGSMSYFHSAGVVYPTLHLNDEPIRTSLDGSRLPYRCTWPLQGAWFMQSGHGISKRLAGLQTANEGYMYLFDPAGATRVVHEVLKRDWIYVNVLILNSCYNLNLDLTSGEYPSHGDIWREDRTRNSMAYKDGRWNNGLKWFEILKKRGVVLGWGQCNVDGTRYGGQSTGQSPMDRQAGIAWTKAVVERLVSETVPIAPLTAADLAREWVEAVLWVYNNEDITPDRSTNMLNAVGIARRSDGDMEVWAIEPGGQTAVSWQQPAE